MVLTGCQTQSMLYTSSNVNRSPIIQQQIPSKDIQLFKNYLEYCKQEVLDTTLIVGYCNASLDTLVTDSGRYLTQHIVVDSYEFDNQERKRIYKNYPSAKPILPQLTPDKKYHWIEITYYCYIRKPTLNDFYSWYYILK